MELSGSTTCDVLPTEYNAMCSIHEYGGGSFTAAPSGKLIFTSDPGNGIFSLDPQTREVRNIVTADKNVRYGNFSPHPITEEWILAVREAHGDTVINTGVAINAQTGKVVTVAEGADFYQHLLFSQDGKKVCWTQWDHPDMPWTGTTLYMAGWEDGELLGKRVISGKAGVESICQPRWSSDGTLFFVSDKTGYWQLYRLDKGCTDARLIHLKGLETAEFGIREPFLGKYVPLTILLSPYEQKVLTR